MHKNLHTTENKQAQFYIGVVIMLMVVLVLGAVFSSFSGSDLYEKVPESVQAAEVSYDTTEEWIPELPTRLVIPRLDVDAVVQYVGLDKNGSGEMAVPSNFSDVGWYTHGVRPGMKGSAVITGHLNGESVAEAVFYDLHTLVVGDEVVVMSADRIEDIFRVVRIETYPYNAPTEEVFVSNDGKARLNLITCGGEWLSDEQVYDTRTVVFTEQVTNVQ